MPTHGLTFLNFLSYQLNPDWSKMPELTDVDDSKRRVRFLSRDELKFSIRSVCEYLPWVNHIYVVSNCEPPPWLDLDHPLISWVDHSQIFPDQDMLPTFNSHAIRLACIESKASRNTSCTSTTISLSDVEHASLISMSRTA